MSEALNPETAEEMKI